MKQCIIQDMPLKTPPTLFSVAATFAVAILLFRYGRCAAPREPNIETSSLLSLVRQERQTDPAMCRQLCLTTFSRLLLIVRQSPFSQYYSRRTVIFRYLINCQRSCQVVNECEMGVANCDQALSTCQDTPSGFSCLCNPGFTGDGRLDGPGCQDIDECSSNAESCGANADCMNTEGSFTCTCQTGFTGDHDGQTCVDINECAGNTDNCDATNSVCTNTAGSFTCSCQDGYQGDGVTSCTDIDECSSNTDSCGDNGDCFNTDGSFVCACQIGFTGDGQTCTDVDECSEGFDNCDATNAVCTNTVGDFTCSCQNGYQGNGVTSCIDIDECATNKDNCDANADCANTDGSFTCTCQMGFFGNGVTCCPNPIISIDTANSVLTVAESALTVTVCISIQNELKSSITIQLTTADGSATAQSGDYVEIRSQLTLSSDGQCFDLSIIIDDPLDEPDETFTINLLTMAQNVGLGVTMATVTILDND